MKLELGNVSLQEIDLKSEDSGDEVSDARHTGPARFNGFLFFQFILYTSFLSLIKNFLSFTSAFIRENKLAQNKSQGNLEQR